MLKFTYFTILFKELVKQKENKLSNILYICIKLVLFILKFKGLYDSQPLVDLFGDPEKFRFCKF